MRFSLIMETVNQVATIENAQEWNGLTDQFVFCLDLLGLSLTVNGDYICDRAVEALENRFEQLLNNPLR